MVKATPGHLEGEVRQVDEASAKALVERGDAKESDGPSDGGSAFGKVSSSRAGFVTQIAEADPPPDQKLAQTEGATKAELVEQAKGRLTDDDGVPLTDSEVGKLTKAELKSRLEGSEGVAGAGTGGAGTGAVAGSGVSAPGTAAVGGSGGGASAP
jgi:hypothetical protein